VTTRRILLVDDERTVLTMLAMALDDPTWAIEAVATPAEALDRLELGRYDLLITDKNLPGMSGVELIRVVRARDRQMPVILITGYASLESAIETLNLGITAYLEKPFPDIRELRRVVREALERRAQALALEAPFAAAAPRPKPARALKVLVGSPRAAVRETIAGLLSGGVDAVSVAGTAEELRAAVAGDAPDVVILDGAQGGEDLAALAAALGGDRGRALVVVADQGLALLTVVRLIRLEVRALIDVAPDHPTFAARLAHTLERLRAG
jgi:DNA-binding NtrC family response regulator